ncbi:nitrate- and nitrite sensing domain-containing protein [Nocardia asteroides]|uniref:sensor histidine kinase n=1 Tax=Nocardia asteroides TaxID=1824 RepID=UPI001E32A796|nr:nitrate- and nitrite sensing domain-containing protein [Nocardia asteroides]UGT63103.1 ATP-binding protein [Nocardia asteroides]
MKIPRLGVRARVLAVALVPSVAVLLVGSGTVASLVSEADFAAEWATQMQQTLPQTVEVIGAIQGERLVTMAHLAGDRAATTRLAAARAAMDTAIRKAFEVQAAIDTIDRDAMMQNDAFDQLTGVLVTVRAGADAGALPLEDAYRFYNGILDTILDGTANARNATPDAEVAVQIADGIRLLQAAESMSRGNALGYALDTAATANTANAAELTRRTGYYRTELAAFTHDIDERDRTRTTELMATPAWQVLEATERAVLTRAALRATEAGSLPALPVTPQEWQVAAAEVSERILNLWVEQSHDTQALATENADATERNSQLAAAAMLTVSLLALGVSLLLANRILRRLRRLRAETLELADHRLPEVMQQLGADRTVDPATVAPRLDFGTDEIGQVASAFERAAAAAMRAAVAERRTREGVRTVFLHMARRSQVVVHRQLELLDEAERAQEDPELLGTLFKLDHLATRERRNAENLIVLGGGQVGRRWRHAVALIDLVRSAVGETLDYSRVRVTRLPELHIIGGAVADLVHLLAELTDNAVTFSPPQSRVEISGTADSRGVLLVIEDQGTGMMPADIVRVNATLANPPDFGTAGDSRLGLFVVARLAARHDIEIELGESVYGGIRATVLLPARLAVSEPVPMRG